MVPATDVSKTIFYPSDQNEFCVGLGLLLLEKQAATFSDILMLKLLLYLIKYWNKKAYLRNNINNF